MHERLPRGAGVEGEEASYDFGTGAGFYVDADLTNRTLNKMVREAQQALPGKWRRTLHHTDEVASGIIVRKVAAVEAVLGNGG